MRKAALAVAVVSAVAWLAPASAQAQGVPLSQLLVKLIQQDIELAPPPPGFPSHAAHFEPGSDQKLAPYLFNQQIVSQLTTFPIGSSSGGFSYTFDPSLGTFHRTTDSFGPAFAERVQTNGRGRLTVGATYQHSNYNSFLGQHLDNGDVKFYLRHIPTGGAFFEGDLVEADLHLKLTSSTATVFANYGVTDKWDVAVAIPFQRVSMDATADATVLRLATENLPIHAFPGGGTTASFSSSGSASGVGDIVLRTKYRLSRNANSGLAAGVDLRLPTGDSANLLGSGTSTAIFTLIGSSTYGPLSPHVNVSYSASGTGDVVVIPNEFGFRVGTELAASPKATLSADLIGRRLFDASPLVYGDTNWTYRNAGGVPGSTTLRELMPTQGALNLYGLALGGKVNVAGNLLVNANVVIALNSSSVVSRVTPVVGFDYSF